MKLHSSAHMLVLIASLLSAPSSYVFADEPTEIDKLAASMKPGQWAELKTEGKFLAYDPIKNEWKELPAEGLPFAKYTGHSVSAAPIATPGVVLFFSSEPQGMKTYLYKHANEPRA